MLDTFKARLKAKAKAAGANLSQKRIDAIADRLHKKFPDLTEEADHEAKLEDYYDDDTLKDIAKDDDKLRTIEAIKPKPQPQPSNDNNPQPQPQEEMPAWAKDLLTEVKTLKQEKQQQSIQQKLGQHEKLKDINKTFWSKRALPTKDEDIDAFVEEVTTDHAAFLQESGYGNIGEHKPPASTEKPIPGKVKVDPALVAYAKKQNEKALASKK
jgi:superfamily I DNA and/or RNA helicase